MNKMTHITPGRAWPAIDGSPIESHLGGVLYDNGIYYWYGVNWNGPTIPPQTLPGQSFSWFLNRGITIYSCTDLLNWKNESTVLADVSCKLDNLLQPLNVLIRPKVIKNDTTGQYVLMAAMTSPDFETFNDVVVATAKSPTGPYEFHGMLGWENQPNMTGIWNDLWIPAAEDPPERIRGFDMGLYKDDDGKAYLLVAHKHIYLYELSKDYLSVHSVERLAGASGEAPAVFKADRVYYLVCSELSGWASNSNKYFTAPSIRGPWTAKGPFAEGPRQETTFDSQVTFVLPVAGVPDAFIFMADAFGAVSTTTIPDLSKATHVWLPIELDKTDKTIRVAWKDSWAPSEAWKEP